MFLFCFSLGLSQDVQQTIVIESFDDESYSHWIKEGSAFNYEPSGEEDEHHMVGFLGKGFAASGNWEVEHSVGTLTSPDFPITHNTIHFLVGGHDVHFMPGTTEGHENLKIQVLVDDRVVRSTSPDEYHEGIAVFGPDQHPEDVLEKKPALILADLEGTVDNHNWINGPPEEEEVNFDKKKMHIVNFKSDYNMFTIGDFQWGGYTEEKSLIMQYSQLGITGL
jgi:hypothetical protein